jgi:hypothetical protein
MPSVIARRVARRLRGDRKGVALTEFAFTLPVVLVLILYGLEVSNYCLALLRVHQIAATSADNAARVRDSISEDDVNEVLIGGKTIGEKMDFANRGRIVLSDVLANGLAGSNAGQTILWQRCTGALNIPASQPAYGLEGKGASDASLPAMGTAGHQIAPTATSAMVFAEVTYRYKPVISSVLFGTPILRSEASFIVRERPSEALTASPGTTVSRCTTYGT